jgi:hypothetical protein
MTTNFVSPLSFVAVFGSGIRDQRSGIRDQRSGMGKNPDPDLGSGFITKQDMDPDQLYLDAYRDLNPGSKVGRIHADPDPDDDQTLNTQS